MSANKFFFLTLVLLGACALVAGCGSDSVAPTDDEAPILPPTGVSAMTSGASRLELTWDPNSHPRLAGYEVYRLDVDSQELVKLTSTPITETLYQDQTAMRGVEYEYRVTALTKSNKESAYAAIPVLLQLLPKEQPKPEN